MHSVKYFPVFFLYDYAFVAGAPFILAAIAGLIRFGRKGRAYEADK